jgi:taurine dioxygenase
MNPPFEIVRVAGVIGAEIRGVDLKLELEDNVRHALRAAWLEHLVLFFPGQFRSATELRRFAGYWGMLEATDAGAAKPIVNNVLMQEAPGMVELAASEGNTADIWHADLTILESPPLAAALCMVKLPGAGGDTMWSSQYAAFAALWPPMQHFLEGFTAIHDFPLLKKRVEHLLVRVHPETGQRFLYVNQRYTRRIAQLSRGESDALLDYLNTHCVAPRFCVRYRWSEGTVAIWDNRCT